MALCLVQDAMSGHAVDEALLEHLIQHCKGARMRYVQYLDDEKEKNNQTANEREIKDLHHDMENVKAEE